MRADSASTFCVKRSPASSSQAAVRADQPWRWPSAARWSCAAPRRAGVFSVAMMRLRSSSMALSRAMLSDSLSRSCATGSAAARGASDAVCTRRRDLGDGAARMGLGLRRDTPALCSSMAQICACCARVCSPACCHSRCSVAAIVVSAPVQAVTAAAHRGRPAYVPQAPQILPGPDASLMPSSCVDRAGESFVQRGVAAASVATSAAERCSKLWPKPSSVWPRRRVSVRCSARAPTAPRPGVGDGPGGGFEAAGQPVELLRRAPATWPCSAVVSRAMPLIVASTAAWFAAARRGHCPPGCAERLVDRGGQAGYAASACPWKRPG